MSEDQPRSDAAASSAPGAGGGGLDREAEDITVALMAASRLIVALSARALASVDVPLTVPQLRSLVTLRTRGPITLTTLAADLEVNPSTALRMVERLEAQQLVDRRSNPSNRRETLLQLTPKAQELVDRVLHHRRTAIRALVERLPGRERAVLVPALTALTAAADELGLVPEPSSDVGGLAVTADDPLSPSPPPEGDAGR
ncbi:MarR family winged helix-turn-helix transcriptional regulator [Streptomyces sp. NPDC014006]|uniref:MarR family winged helix-turn-helix transcriptional regulator n=1 Tax=Streptomyces sp. NPDC014006 TaxID=3364870 RepID=UPI0036FE4330